MKKIILILIGLLFILGCGDKEIEKAVGQDEAVIKVAPPEEEKKTKEEVPIQKEPLTTEVPKEIASLEPTKPSEPEKEKESPAKIAWGNAPDFTLKRIGEGDYTLSKEAKNKVVILDFFATWCGPCKMEIPGFVELYQEYKDQGLEIIGASVDGDPPKVIPSFANKYGIDYPILIADPMIVAAYGGIRGIPTTFIIDKKGNVVNKHVGYVSKKVFEEEIKELLGSSQ